MAGFHSKNTLITISSLDFGAISVSQRGNKEIQRSSKLKLKEMTKCVVPAAKEIRDDSHIPTFEV